MHENNVFAREVPCSNIAYHSRYIACAGPKLLKYLQKVIPDPKPRSSKWLSTSVPRSEWNTAVARLSSAEYHTNNLLSPVLFEETSSLIPKNAITIEIAPHGLLQAILRRSLPESVTNVSLTYRGHKDNVEALAQALGKLYNAGLQPQISNLYPKVEYPVSRGTPMISHLIKWEHSDDWYVTSYRMQEKITSGERLVEVTLGDETYEYMAGHIIDGRNLIPATGYLALIWETVGMMRGDLYTEVSVVFEDVKFLRATTLPKEGTVELTLMIQKGSGRFEVVEGGSAVVTGCVRHVSNPNDEKVNIKFENAIEEDLSSQDVYKELRLRGYHYTGLFRGIKSTNIKGTAGYISWNNNWVAFMDNMLQMEILGLDSRGLFVPTGIQKLVIDTKLHLSQIRSLPDENKSFPVFVDKINGVINSGGVQIRNLKANAISRRKFAGEPVIEEYKFVAHLDHDEMSLRDISRISTQITLENIYGIKVKTIELIDEIDDISTDHLLSPHLADSLGDMPLIQAEINIVTTKNIYEDGSIPSNITILDPKKITAETNAYIGVGHHLLSQKRNHNLNLLMKGIKDGGFLLSREAISSKNPEEFARSHGLDVILVKRCDKEIIVLLRKRDKVARKTEVIYVENNKLNWVEDLKKTMIEVLESDVAAYTRVIIVGQTDFDNGLLGLVNCLRKEPGGEIVRGVLIQDPTASKFSLDETLYAKQLEKDLSINVLRPNVIWGSYRHLPIPKPVPRPVKHAWANQLVRGDLGSLVWLEGPCKTGSKVKNLVNVFYSSINFRDVMLATGKLATELVGKTRMDQECVLGFEYVGIMNNGKRVMGLLDSKAMTTVCINDEHLTWEVPKNWTLEDAATVPCVYATSYYALYLSGKMKKGDKILIHSGTGGVGQAAITLALHEGCEVFTTVGTPEKRNFIRENFPKIKEDHIGNSRDTSFEQMIMNVTNGKGVDIVLNSLAEEKLQASVRCLTHGGRFLEIGKFDLAANNPLGMEIFLREISFHGILLDNVFHASEEKKMSLKEIVSQGLKNGAIKPLVRTVFPKDQLEAAFRFMASGKHIGKVILKVRNENEPLDSLTLGLPRFYCLEDRSYIILGGLGGFGLELTDWLVMRGAKNIILTSRNGIKNGYQKMRINIWKSYGVKIIIVTGKDAANEHECRQIIETASKIAPVDGIFNLAVVLKDGLWENQTPETFGDSFRPKAWSTQVLDEVSRKLCPSLRHFVVFSSVSCGRGNVGQINYGMSNSIMERICEKRVFEGYPGLAVQWGAVGDVGLVADMQEENKEIVIGGTLQQKILSCLQELDNFLQHNYTIVSSMVVAEKRAGGAGTINMVDTVLNIMGLKDLKTVSIHTSLAEMGMDSMMAVEIKQTFEREFEIFLSAQDIRNLNFAKIQDMAAKEALEEKKRNVGKTEAELLTGMKLFVKIFGSEDLRPEVSLKIETLNDETRGEVFLIPGIEGFGSIFSNLATMLKSPATCLQFELGHETPLSISEMAERLLPHVLERNKGRRDFVLVGYSYGSVITVELVRLLEAEGLIGRIVLIDGAPEQSIAIKDQQLAANNHNELESNILLGIMDMLDPVISSELVVELEKCKSWTEKLEAFIKHVPTENMIMSRENQKLVCTAIYQRLLALEDYDLSNLKPIRSPIILIKPTMPSVRNLPEDYGLSKITKEKVEVYHVDGNHVTILDNKKVAHAINGDPMEDADAFKARIMEDGKILASISQ